jgi:4-amino-4-deoxy-L-arabinose transferase-like glycosyltransferase
MTAGLILRLPGLETRPIWYDEAFSILLAARPFGQVVSGTAADTMPPLYYAMLGLWQSLGQAIWAQRLLNVFLGVALIGLVFLLGRELYGRTAAGWAAALAAVSPLLVYHAQELRMYTLLTLSLTGYVLCFVLARQGGGRRARGWWAGVVLAGTLALYTHNLAIFSIVALDAFLLLRRDWAGLSRLLLAQVAMIVLFLPWLRFVPGQVQKIQEAFWTPRPGLLEGVQALVSFHSSLPLESWLLILGVTASRLAVSLAAYIFLRRLPLTWRRLLACLLLVPPLCSSSLRPSCARYSSCGLSLSLVGYLLLAGRAISEVRPRALGWILAGAFAAAAAVGLPAQATHRTFPRSPFREAAAHLAATTAGEDLVLHSNKLSYFPMVVYDSRLPQSFLADEPGSHNDTLAPATQASPRAFSGCGRRERRLRRRASPLRYLPT